MRKRLFTAVTTILAASALCMSAMASEQKAPDFTAKGVSSTLNYYREDSTETKEDIISKVSEKSQKYEVTANADVDAVITFTSYDQDGSQDNADTDFSIDLTGTMKYDRENKEAYVDGKASVGFLGLNEDVQSQAYYLVNNDGDAVSVSKTSETKTGGQNKRESEDKWKTEIDSSRLWEGNEYDVIAILNRAELLDGLYTDDNGNRFYIFERNLYINKEGSESNGLFNSAISEIGNMHFEDGTQYKYYLLIDADTMSLSRVICDLNGLKGEMGNDTDTISVSFDKFVLEADVNGLEGTIEIPEEVTVEANSFEK